MDIDVKRLRLEPSDIVAVKVHGNALPNESADRLKAAVSGVMAAAGHQNQVMILPPDIDIAVFERRPAAEVKT